MSLPDTDKWLEAITSELNSLKKNSTWMEVNSVPEGIKQMGSCWVFRKKTEADGSKVYKARLVIKGYEQHYGVNYTKTYAPVVNLCTIRCLFTLAAYLNLEVHHMDVSTAFLNAELPEDERAYM
jgi:Reverse transcriptase (RNA-dependent DNA polymerase)